VVLKLEKIKYLLFFIYKIPGGPGKQQASQPPPPPAADPTPAL